MLITKPLQESEATYQLTNTLKEYRTRYKLFVFKKPITKTYANLELNRELSPQTKRGHTELTEHERQTKDMNNEIRSVRRSRTKISDIIEMNDFKYFGTLTTDPQKIDRYDDLQVKKRVTKTLTNLQRTYRFEYLLIPERHKDSALHFHALFTELPLKWLYDSGKRDKTGRILYNLKPYKLGFSNFSAITSLQATAKYCAKYVSKALDESDKGKKRYWHSKGLKKPEKHENVDTHTYIDRPNVELWEAPEYTGYQIPKEV